MAKLCDSTPKKMSSARVAQFMVHLAIDCARKWLRHCGPKRNTSWRKLILYMYSWKNSCHTYFSHFELIFSLCTQKMTRISMGLNEAKQAIKRVFLMQISYFGKVLKSISRCTTLILSLWYVSLICSIKYRRLAG